MCTDLVSTVPVLASPNLRETVTFYTAKLDFGRRLLMNDYAIVRRGGAEIHFRLCHDCCIAGSSACYVRVTDTGMLYEEFVARGVHVYPPSAPRWGMKELNLIDPHGNHLKFSEWLAVDRDCALRRLHRDRPARDFQDFPTRRCRSEQARPCDPGGADFGRASQQQGEPAKLSCVVRNRDTCRVACCLRTAPSITVRSASGAPAAFAGRGETGSPVRSTMIRCKAGAAPATVSE